MLLTPAEKTTADVWGSKNRVYPKSAGIPGPRDPGRTPYIIAFERFFADPRYETGVLICGTQTSKTDGILDAIGWRLDTKPRPQLYVGPSKDFVSEQFEPRLMALFDESERLRDRVARGKRNKRFKKVVNGVNVRMAWAGSPTSLASDQAGDVYIDEYSKMFRVSAKGGDPYVLAKARADTYADRKIAITSTPEDGKVSVERDAASGLEFWAKVDPVQIDCATWRRWQIGTRHHLAWRCPHCSDWFIPRMRDLRWNGHPDGSPGEARRSTFLLCPNNGCVIEERAKEAMNADHRFVAPGEFIRPDGSIGGDPEDGSTISWWVSGLASPFLSWGERAEEMLSAKASGDPQAVKAVINKAGELYAEEAGDAPEWKAVAALCLPYAARHLPERVVFITAGVDVQKNRLFYAIRGWGARQESWLLDCGQLWGDTGEDDVWNDLSDVLQEPIGVLRVRRAFIDSGFRPNKRDSGSEHRVYEFARQHSQLVYACKGFATRQTPLSVNRIDVAPHGGRSKYGLDLVRLDTDFFKSWVHQRLNWPADQPGGFHLFEDVGEDYCRQLVSEARERLPNGSPVWHERSPDNHYLDCEALAYAAAFMMGVQKLSEDVARAALARRPDAAPQAAIPGAAPAEIRARGRRVLSAGI